GPGNIRELENMMKRFVVLQDESLILAELARLRAAAAAAAAQAPPATASRSVDEAPAAPPAPPPPSSAPPPVAATSDEAPGVEDTSDTPDSDEGVNLQALARSAAMQAEREAIDHALARFRWNRRKAAAYLNVSYKTLLN